MTTPAKEPLMYSNTCTQHEDDPRRCLLQRQAAAGIAALRQWGVTAATVSVMDPLVPGHVAVAAVGSIGVFVRANGALERHRREQLGDKRPSVVAWIRSWIGGRRD